MHGFFEADESPRRAFTAYPRRAAGAVVVVRWVRLADGHWRFRDRLDLKTQDAIETLLDCERTQAHDAALALFGAVSRLPGLSPKLLDGHISSALGEDHAQFTRPDAAPIRFLDS